MNSRSLVVSGLALLILNFACGCGKQSEPPAAAVPVATNQAVAAMPQAGPGAPEPAPTPAAPAALETQNGNTDAILAELTRELHRTMIGRRLSGSFEEFVAVRNLKVPPPPPGKKYAISKQWNVVLVNQ